MRICSNLSKMLSVYIYILIFLKNCSYKLWWYLLSLVDTSPVMLPCPALHCWISPGLGIAAAGQGKASRGALPLCGLDCDFAAAHGRTGSRPGANSAPSCAGLSIRCPMMATDPPNIVFAGKTRPIKPRLGG